MRIELCQGVSAFLVVGVTACAASNRGGLAPDAGEDAAARVDGGSADAAALDAGAVDASASDAAMLDGGAAALDAGASDAALPDSGAANPPFWPTLWCTQAPGGVLANASGTLSFSYEGCCVDDIVCVAHADAASSVLDLNITANDYSQVCDCDPSVVERPCDLPPLALGTWSVHINGDYGFDLPVLAAVSEERGTLCFDPAGPVEGMLRCETPPEAWANVGEACHHRQGIDVAHSGVRLVDGCGGCFEHFAGCSIAVDGDALHVTPLKRACACDTCGACPEVCMRSEQRCLLPRLPPGDYTVSYEGTAGATTLQILDYAMLTGPIDIDEVCATNP